MIHRRLKISVKNVTIHSSNLKPSTQIWPLCSSLLKPYLISHLFGFGLASSNRLLKYKPWSKYLIFSLWCIEVRFMCVRECTVSVWHQWRKEWWFLQEYLIYLLNTSLEEKDVTRPKDLNLYSEWPLKPCDQLERSCWHLQLKNWDLTTEFGRSFRSGPD